MTATPTGGAPQRVCQPAVDLVKHLEGLYLSAYRCPAGVPTIGYGHTAGVQMGDRITEARADELLAQDLAAAAAQVDRLVRVRVNDEQRGALASFVFNLGAGSLAASTLLKKLNAGDHEGAAGEFGKWVYATVGGVKKQLPGLVARRAAEAALFRSGVGAAVQDLPAGQHHPQPQMGAAPDGDDDDLVRRVQRVVGVKVDGVYGPATHAELRRWQAAHGLVPDGIVGPKTAAAMGVA